MSKQVMRRRASDNVYLHKDFHGALSASIEYLHKTHGPQAVRDYLWQFASAFYAPLKQALKERGLLALKEHFEKIYKIEGAKIDLNVCADEMIMSVSSCPAVTHMRQHSYPVAELFDETTKTVNQAICDGSEFAFELLEYDPQTGRSVQRFYRRPR